MEGNRETTVRGATVGTSPAFGFNLFAKIKSGDTVGAPGPPLAVQAVAERNLFRFAVTGNPKLSASTGCDPRFHGGPDSSDLETTHPRHEFPPNGSPTYDFAFWLGSEVLRATGTGPLFP